MGKQKGARQGGKASSRAESEEKRGRFTPMLIVAAALVVAVGSFLWLGGVRTAPPGQGAAGGGAYAALRETNPTLAPEDFTGVVRQAYQAARDIPEVLDRLYCYCRCRENHGHKNLLSCYVGTHAST